MKDDNRIVQGGELNLGNGNLGTAPAPDTNTQPSQNTDGFPTVNMDPLDKALIYYLEHRGSDNLTSRNPPFCRVDNSLLQQPIRDVVTALGHNFFQIVNPHYVTPFSDDKFLMGDIQLNPQIPLNALKTGIASLLGQPHVDYFIREFGDRIGIIDETKPIDISKPEVARYLPGLLELQKIPGTSAIIKDPYMLLLLLDTEQRKYFTLFFNEANKNGQIPFMFTLPTTTKSAHLPDYAFTKKDISDITENPQIIPFKELLRIGLKYDIKGMASYADRLEQFREYLRNIPEK